MVLSVFCQTIWYKNTSQNLAAYIVTLLTFRILSNVIPSMAKNAVTPEVIELIMVKITDKFTDVLNTIMNQFSVMLTNTVNAQLAVINSRLDNISGGL